MVDLLSTIRKALGYVRVSVTAGVEGDHEAALRRLERQRLRLMAIDAVVDANRAAGQGRH